MSLAHLRLWLALALALSSCELKRGRGAHPGELEGAQAQAWVALGRHLFYERRLSLNEDRSCGICHEQAKGFTDGFVRAVGTTGELHPRNTATLINVAQRPALG